MLKPTAKERGKIATLLSRFDEKRENLGLFHDTVQRAISSSKKLHPLIHSMRARIKDRDHLQDKLLRKLRECEEKGTNFNVTPDNLHVKINDLAGIRLLHLHTSQAKEIHDHLHELLKSCGYKFREGPEARTWDIEYEKIFKEMGFKTKQSETLYTSVHYVISDQIPGLLMTCELQVRTLAEELWGEVDHKLNYPHKMDSVACVQQIRALARATSAAGRLVDSIFATVKDEQDRKKHSPPTRSRKLTPVRD
jgi:ppGpp synthetase/RelA/SpoT-type nucleotidyltranferase